MRELKQILSVFLVLVAFTILSFTVRANEPNPYFPECHEYVDDGELVKAKSEGTLEDSDRGTYKDLRKYYLLCEDQWRTSDGLLMWAINNNADSFRCLCKYNKNWYFIWGRVCKARINQRINVEPSYLPPRSDCHLGIEN